MEKAIDHLHLAVFFSIIIDLEIGMYHYKHAN